MVVFFASGKLAMPAMPKSIEKGAMIVEVSFKITLYRQLLLYVIMYNIH